MLCHPCILGDPQRQARGVKSEVVPTYGQKKRSGCLSPAFSGAQKRAEMLRHPGILEDPQHRETNYEVAASPLPSPEAK